MMHNSDVLKTSSGFCFGKIRLESSGYGLVALLFMDIHKNQNPTPNAPNLSLLACLKSQ